ncbi:uncharacterized protein TrAtP1_008605 [Trichoderma atroviride]|uniref:uncharacterized protein n=1 Tax=Hypocrea atroviridis TaxID=63577 RepID=UPI003325499C|nr:hypothetical protein TrAtP1_008605 [Trichoderma atroviride]
MPPPMQTLETAFQVQEPVLVEGREVSVVEDQHEKKFAFDIEDVFAVHATRWVARSSSIR